MAKNASKRFFKPEDLNGVLGSESMKSMLSRLVENLRHHHPDVAKNPRNERMVQAAIYHRIMHEAFYQKEAEFIERHIGVEYPFMEDKDGKRKAPDFCLFDVKHPHTIDHWVELKEYVLRDFVTKEVDIDCKKMSNMDVSHRTMLIVTAGVNPEEDIEELKSSHPSIHFEVIHVD